MAGTNTGIDPLKTVANAAGRDMVVWRAPGGEQAIQMAGPALLRAGLEFAERSRGPKRYKTQANHHGMYYFSRNRRHVWFESGLEHAALTWLDFRGDVAKVVSQPCLVQFRDGRHCFPDFFVTYTSGKQGLVDVHAHDKISERHRESFTLLSDTCDRIGWGYELFTGIPFVLLQNLRLIGSCRDSRYSPTDAARQSILAAASEPISIQQALELFPSSPNALTASVIYHMLWNHDVFVDLTQPLTSRTTITTTRNDHAAKHPNRQ